MSRSVWVCTLLSASPLATILYKWPLGQRILISERKVDSNQGRIKALRGPRPKYFVGPPPHYTYSTINHHPTIHQIAKFKKTWQTVYSIVCKLFYKRSHDMTYCRWHIVTDEICDRSCDYLRKFRGDSSPKNVRGEEALPHQLLHHRVHFLRSPRPKNELHIGLYLKSVISRVANSVMG